jgi:hypothetical protein
LRLIKILTVFVLNFVVWRRWRETEGRISKVSNKRDPSLCRFLNEFHVTVDHHLYQFLK